MYGYNQYVQLTSEAILSRVKEEDIFGIVIKEEICLDEECYYSAPYRTDNNAGCYFRKYDDVLYFTDWADEVINKDCFEFIKTCYRLNSIYESYKVINEVLNLGLGDSTSIAKEVISIKRSKRREKKTIDKSITILPRNFEDKDRVFWSQYEISKQNLIDDGVIPVEMYQAVSKKGKKFTVNPFDVAYAYTNFPENRKKIYRPYGNKKEKWLTNCNQNDIGCIDFLNDEDNTIIITKSYKDCRVLRNQGLNCVWFQSERMFPSRDILEELIRGYTNIIIWFDNDNTGIASSRVLKNYINSFSEVKAKTIILPPVLLEENIKDPSDLIALKGKSELLEFLKKYNLL